MKENGKIEEHKLALETERTQSETESINIEKLYQIKIKVIVKGLTGCLPTYIKYGSTAARRIRCTHFGTMYIYSQLLM